MGVEDNNEKVKKAVETTLDSHITFKRLPEATQSLVREGLANIVSTVDQTIGGDWRRVRVTDHGRSCMVLPELQELPLAQLGGQDLLESLRSASFQGASITRMVYINLENIMIFLQSGGPRSVKPEERGLPVSRTGLGSILRPSLRAFGKID